VHLDTSWIKNDQFVFAFYVSKFLLGVLLFTNTTQPLFFLPPFCGAQTRPLPLLLVCRIRQRAWLRPSAGGKQTAFFKGGTNAAHLLLQLWLLTLFIIASVLAFRPSYWLFINFPW
jgi:hypothetical protein